MIASNAITCHDAMRVVSPAYSQRLESAKSGPPALTDQMICLELHVAAKLT